MVEREASCSCGQLRVTRTFHFCPQCGATVYYGGAYEPDDVAVPVGAFADPDFPMPGVSAWEEREHDLVALPEGVERYP